jgi:hypothetical protein
MMLEKMSRKLNKFLKYKGSPIDKTRIGYKKEHILEEE